MRQDALFEVETLSFIDFVNVILTRTVSQRINIRKSTHSASFRKIVLTFGGREEGFGYTSRKFDSLEQTLQKSKFLAMDFFRWCTLQCVFVTEKISQPRIMVGLSGRFIKRQHSQQLSFSHFFKLRRKRGTRVQFSRCRAKLFAICFY